MKKAVTYGRFNYFSIGHMSFFKEILKEWDTLDVLLLIDRLDSRLVYKEDRLNRFIELCDKNVREKELLDIDHRINAMRATINSDEILKKRITVSPFIRPDINVAVFNAIYPPDRYDFVLSNDNSTSWDNEKNIVFKDILLREASFVTPELILHNSEIRKNNMYEEGLCKNSYQYYLENNLINQ